MILTGIGLMNEQWIELTETTCPGTQNSATKAVVGLLAVKGCFVGQQMIKKSMKIMTTGQWMSQNHSLEADNGQ